MRSLAIRLTLAFLLVGLVGSALAAIMIQQRTRLEFTQLIRNQSQETLVPNLGQYYQSTGSWAGVEAVFRSAQRPLPVPQELDNHFDPRRSLFTLTDSSGQVIYGRSLHESNTAVPASELEKGTPVEVDGEIVGWLLFNPALERWKPGTPEGAFLSSVNSAIVLSALVATASALLMGGVLAYTMTRSLRELTTATRELAQGKLGRQVSVRTKDEIGELAKAFNQMSAALAHSNELRRKMTADIAHDLRTPLSVILGYTEALSDAKLQPTPEMFSVMHRETLHLGRLVDDLRTLSLADAGELPLNLVQVAPGELIQRTAEAYRVKAENKGIRLQIESQPDLPPLSVDVDRMAQVLGNLMNNALRYTPNGGEICLAAEEVGGEIRLRLADNGAGIAPEDLPYIFERSYRGDKARQQQEDETGLGLAIARSLVEAQGGRISVESAPGQGAAFTIHFPIPR
ncbi:MAG: HAMP domain-containing protein [Anaerolineales bacterium]|nr:HAMP domain-containing protein [Anaerolineales bacterium]